MFTGDDTEGLKKGKKKKKKRETYNDHKHVLILL